MADHPNFSTIKERLHPKAWYDRVVVWAGAIVTGLSVVGFVWLTDHGTAWFFSMREKWFWFPLVATPLGGIVVVFLTRRYASLAAGSGIPQVMAALDKSLTTKQARSFVRLRIAVAKAVLGATAIAVGFSSGREGPSVQIASAVLLSFRKLIRKGIIIHERDLILAGGAAGIAAAFNAPLAGVVFAIEELGKSFEERSRGMLVSAIVIAGLVAVWIMGNLTYFGRLQIETLDYGFIAPAVLVSLAAGVFGGLFSRLLVSSFSRSHWPIVQWRQKHPVWFAGMCGLIVAVLGTVTNGEAFGSGYAWSKELLSNQGDVSAGYFLVKSVSTWLSFWSGIPGGLFAPSLAIGAGIGHDVALLTHSANVTPIIALGMAGFLAAVTQAPITSSG